MRKHRELVVRTLSRLDHRARLLFGLLATERLRACCFADNKTIESWQVFCDSIDIGFAMVCDSAELDTDRIIEMEEQLETHVPAGGEPLQVQSQSAWICLREAFKACDPASDESIELVVNSVIDALDNYTFFVQRWISGSTASPEGYLLLDRELQKQLEDLQYVESHKSYSESDVQSERIRNMQFAVPVAIGGTLVMK